jgi:hypothetical protein
MNPFFQQSVKMLQAVFSYAVYGRAHGLMSAYEHVKAHLPEPSPTQPEITVSADKHDYFGYALEIRSGEDKIYVSLDKDGDYSIKSIEVNTDTSEGQTKTITTAHRYTATDTQELMGHIATGVSRFITNQSDALKFQTEAKAAFATFQNPFKHKESKASILDRQLKEFGAFLEATLPERDLNDRELKVTYNPEAYGSEGASLTLFIGDSTALVLSRRDDESFRVVRMLGDDDLKKMYTNQQPYSSIKDTESFVVEYLTASLGVDCSRGLKDQYDAFKFKNFSAEQLAMPLTKPKPD